MRLQTVFGAELNAGGDEVARRESAVSEMRVAAQVGGWRQRDGRVVGRRGLQRESVSCFWVGEVEEGSVGLR